MSFGKLSYVKVYRTQSLLIHKSKTVCLEFVQHTVSYLI